MTSIVREASELSALAKGWQREGLSIGLVPTMGALHDGHLSLVRAAREACDRVVVSIFVNPLQFGPNEDFARYPRDLEKDRALLATVGCDAIFVPDAAAFVPPSAATRVDNEPLAARFEGAVRPGHFRGVLTIVAKLFHVARADQAFFGQKDAQQVLLVRAMARDLDFPVEVVTCPIVREAGGLAMSSRNAYLSPAGRASALAISRALSAVEEAFSRGERDTSALLALAQSELHLDPTVQKEYVALVDPETLLDVARIPDAGQGLLLIAARVDGTRLLDNALLGKAP